MIVAEATTMATFLTSVGAVVTDVIGWVGQSAETIMTTPILLFTTGFLAIGGSVGILGRLLSKR